METSRADRATALVGPGEARNAANSRLPLFAVLLLATALRLYQLGTESLWIDEGFSLRDATTPFTLAKASKPLYYWILSYWIKLGEADWLLRLPAVIFGVASVAMVFALGRLVWNARVGTLAALLAAVSPLHVNHSQEVRMYTLLMLEALISVYFLILVLRTWRFRYMAASALFAWLAILTQPMACLLLVPENLAILDAYIRRRRPLLPWIATQAAVMAAWLPWLPYVLGFGGYFEQSWVSMLDKPAAADMPRLWGEFGIGDWNPKFGDSAMHSMLFVYTHSSLLLIALIAWLDRRSPEARLVAMWLFLPGAALLTLSIMRFNSLIPRYLVFTAPAFLLLLGAVWARQRNRLLVAVLGLVLFLVPVGKLVRYYQKTTRAEWRQAVKYVTDFQRPTDVIGVFRFGNGYVFDHYYNGRARWVALGSPNYLKSEMTGWNERKALKLIASMPRGPRQWLIVSRVPSAADTAIDAAVKDHYRMLDSRKFNSIAVYLFEGVSYGRTQD